MTGGRPRDGLKQQLANLQHAFTNIAAASMSTSGQNPGPPVGCMLPPVRGNLIPPIVPRPDLAAGGKAPSMNGPFPANTGANFPSNFPNNYAQNLQISEFSMPRMQPGQAMQQRGGIQCPCNPDISQPEHALPTLKVPQQACVACGPNQFVGVQGALPNSTYPTHNPLGTQEFSQTQPNDDSAIKMALMSMGLYMPGNQMLPNIAQFNINMMDPFMQAMVSTSIPTIQANMPRAGRCEPSTGNERKVARNLDEKEKSKAPNGKGSVAKRQKLFRPFEDADE